MIFIYQIKKYKKINENLDSKFISSNIRKFLSRSHGSMEERLTSDQKAGGSSPSGIDEFSNFFSVYLMGLNLLINKYRDVKLKFFVYKNFLKNIL